MAIAAGDPVSVGKCAAVSLVAWCDLGDEILLVMERPESCMDLVDYLNAFRVTEALAVVKDAGGPFPLCGRSDCRLPPRQELMKQLVAAAVQMHKAGVFHRDLKLDNILIEQDAAWPVPRVRIIDFGCGCFVMSGYHSYAGGCGGAASAPLAVGKSSSCPHRNLVLQASRVLRAGRLRSRPHHRLAPGLRPPGNPELQQRFHLQQAPPQPSFADPGDSGARRVQR